MRSREGDVATDGQPLDLIEHHLGARGHILVAIALAGQDHADRLGRILAHGVDLAGAGMRAQDHIRIGGEEGILHLARRMAGREVEQLEVVLVRLDFGRVEDLEAHLDQNVDDLADGNGGGMQLADGDRPPRQRDVDAFGAQCLRASRPD